MADYNLPFSGDQTAEYLAKARDFSGVPLDDGLYSGSKTYTAYNQYLNDNGALFKLSPAVALGYSINLGAYPLAKDDPNLIPYISWESNAGWDVIGDFANTPELTGTNDVLSSKSIVGFEDALWRTNQDLPYTPTGTDPTQAPELGKWFAVSIGNLRSVLRSLNAKDTEGVYSTDTTTPIGAGGGVLYIYDASAQVTWGIPAGVGAGETIQSVDGSDLVTSGGNYTLLPNDGGNVEVIAENSTLPASAASRAGRTLFIEDWADGDGVGDKTADVQAAITYCVENKINLSASSLSVFNVSDTLLIPQNSEYGVRILLDLGGCTFNRTVDLPIFNSAYDNAGTLTTSVDTALESHNSFGIDFGGFSATTSFGEASTPTMEIQDWHQGASISEVYDKTAVTALRSINNFYCKFGVIGTLTPSETTGSRFILEGSHNLNDIKHLQATNATVGYNFVGPAIAMSMESMSFEGIGIAAEFNSTVYSCAVKDSYNESISDTHFKFTTPIESFRLSNAYLNFTGEAGSYLLDYLPGPANNFIIEDDNTFINFTDSQFFKAIDTTIGYNMGRITRRKRFASSIDNFLVDNANFPKSTNVIQPLEQSGLKTHAVNNFADGVYAGRFTSGRDHRNGFEWIDNTSATLEIRTKMTPSSTARIYVNLRMVAAPNEIVRGELVGDGNVSGNMDFYEYTATGLDKTNSVTVTLVSGFYHIHYTAANVITDVKGEVRLA